MLGTPDPAWYHTAAPRADAKLRVQYLGTAGFVLHVAGRVVVIDPYVSRPGVLDTLLWPLEPDVSRIRSLIPRADEVLVGHSHYDHVLDAPEVCRQTGARLIGSPDVANVGRAAGLPEAQIMSTRGREDIACGPVTVRGLPSRHGRVYGRVPFPGEITSPPPWPPRFHQLPHGLVLNWFLSADLGGGNGASGEVVRVVHVDSADFIEEELEGVQCDVLCLCAIGRQFRANYTQDAIARLRPKVVIPCHWDVYTTPIEQAPWLLPGVDLPGFVREIQATGVRAAVLPFLGAYDF